MIHLVGTFSNPRDDHRFPEHACALGFVAIVPMYENADAGRNVCGTDGPCYEAFHREVVDGVDGASVNVDAANSVRNRVATLLDHLSRTQGGPWVEVAARATRRDFGTFVVSGHSQGSGHALYLAREDAFERVVLLAGPSDRAGADPAPWIRALETMPLPTARRYGYIHDDDTLQDVASVIDNWTLSGVDDETCAYASAGGYPANCRRIRIASDGCTGINAHAVPVVVRFGARCAIGTGSYRNEATFEFLLTNP